MLKVCGNNKENFLLKKNNIFHLVIVQDDSFIENFVEDKEGIPAITKCVYVNCAEDPNLKIPQKIQKTAIDIIWRLSSYGPQISKKLKSKTKSEDDGADNETKTNLFDNDIYAEDDDDDYRSSTNRRRQVNASKQKETQHSKTLQALIGERKKKQGDI